MSTQQNAYPLSWPPAWKRTPAHQRTHAPFFATRKQASTYSLSGQVNVRGRRSMAEATDEIIREVRALGGERLVISTNVELRQDGLPYSNRRAPDDQGAAVYFALRKKPCVLACDKWNRVEDNLWAIAKHIEALRGQERWGVGSVEQAFAGYTALPAPGESTAATWYNVLGVPADSTFERAREAYIAEAKRCHPDNGGTTEAMQRLNAAWDQARTSFGK